MLCISSFYHPHIRPKSYEITQLGQFFFGWVFVFTISYSIHSTHSQQTFSSPKTGAKCEREKAKMMKMTNMKISFHKAISVLKIKYSAGLGGEWEREREIRKTNNVLLIVKAQQCSHLSTSFPSFARLIVARIGNFGCVTALSILICAEKGTEKSAGSGCGRCYKRIMQNTIQSKYMISRINRELSLLDVILLSQLDTKIQEKCEE